METVSVWITQVAGTSRAVVCTIAERELIGYMLCRLLVSESQDMQPKLPSVSPIQERNGVF
jgi:hypothetical protein